MSNEAVVLILGGLSSSNREWVRDLAQLLHPAFRCVTVDYRHWADGSSLHIILEAKRAVDAVRGADMVFVIAKSAGSLVALEAMKSFGLAPARCIFVGLPLHYARTVGYDLIEGLDGLDASSIILQNANDPAGSSEELRALGMPIVELPASTHEYVPSKILTHVLDFFKTA